MNKITENDINEAFARLDSTKENPFDEIFEKMDKEQPDLIDYLFEVEDEDFNKDERDVLVNISIIAWYILSENFDINEKITNESLDAQLERNINLFDENEQSDGEIDEDTLKLLAKFNKQPEFMEFLTSLVLDRPADYEGNVRKEVELIILIHIKNIVDVIVGMFE